MDLGDLKSAIASRWAKCHPAYNAPCTQQKGNQPMPESQNVVPDERAPLPAEEQAAQLHCHICGNENAYELREIEEPITVGQNTALVRVRAAVCRFCGERVYDL